MRGAARLFLVFCSFVFVIIYIFCIYCGGIILSSSCCSSSRQMDQSIISARTEEAYAIIIGVFIRLWFCMAFVP